MSLIRRVTGHRSVLYTDKSRAKHPLVKLRRAHGLTQKALAHLLNLRGYHTLTGRLFFPDRFSAPTEETGFIHLDQPASGWWEAEQAHYSILQGIHVSGWEYGSSPYQTVNADLAARLFADLEEHGLLKDLWEVGKSVFHGTAQPDLDFPSSEVLFASSPEVATSFGLWRTEDSDEGWLYEIAPAEPVPLAGINAQDWQDWITHHLGEDRFSPAELTTKDLKKLKSRLPAKKGFVVYGAFPYFEKGWGEGDEYVIWDSTRLRVVDKEPL